MQGARVPFIVLHLLWLRPIGADPGPSNMDPVEEAGTVASLDHIIVRLQSSEAADQFREVSDLPLVIDVRSGVVHLVRRGGVKPHVRFTDSSESSVDCGFCLCWFVPRTTQPSPPHPVLEHLAAVTSVQFAPLQSHSCPKTRKMVGRGGERGWDAWWAESCDGKDVYPMLRGPRGLAPKVFRAGKDGDVSSAPGDVHQALWQGWVPHNFRHTATKKKKGRKKRTMSGNARPACYESAL